MKSRTRVVMDPRLMRLLRRAPAAVTERNRREIRTQADLMAQYIRGALYQQGLVRTGELLRSISVRIGSKGLSAEVGPGARYPKGSAARRWVQSLTRWAEGGTRPHYLGRGRLHHPGLRPRPFVSEAFNLRKGPLLEALRRATMQSLKQLGGG